MINILIGFDREVTARVVRARTWFLKYFRCMTRKKENNYLRITQDSFGKDFNKISDFRVQHHREVS